MSVPSNDQPSCDTFFTANRSKLRLTEVDYGGIPDNLLVNVVAWVLLILLFTVLRKLAWDYGRMALVNRDEEKNPINTAESKYNVWTTIFYGKHEAASEVSGSQESVQSAPSNLDEGMFTWLRAFFRMKDIDILHKCGYDALQYLSFQRYLIFYLIIITVLSVGVVLPVNLQGTVLGDVKDFGHTTIGNINVGSPFLWIHATLAVVYLVIVVLVLRHFSVSLETQEDEQVTRTLMVSHIPKEKCYPSLVKQHFQEAHPDVVVEDIQFAYDIAELIKLDNNRQRAQEARIYSEAEFAKTGKRPLIFPYACGRCVCLTCCGCKQVDAINYYSEEESVLYDACEDGKSKAFQKPLGIAFVTFQSDIQAARVRADFRYTLKGCAHNAQPSSVHSELQVSDWAVRFAPAPENIYWENLSDTKHWLYLKVIAINSALVIILFFLTTPSILISVIDEISFKNSTLSQESYGLRSPFLVQILPTLMLVLFSSLLPSIVAYSDLFIGHWTKSAEHHSVMRKTFIFLLMMILVLPALGLTSAKAFFEFVLVERVKKYRWECIFLSGNGAFFVNYIITAAFIGTVLELLRFSELFKYTLLLLLARSSAEKSAVRKRVTWDFQFGVQYAWMLCMFAVIVAYSIISPLITPFGLVYMTMKHLVDRYNIYFAYAPSRIDKYVHGTAITFVAIGVILLQVNIVFFTALRSGIEMPVFIFSCIALFITLLAFIGRLSFGWFKGLPHPNYEEPVPSTMAEETNLTDTATGVPQVIISPSEGAGEPFVADVLMTGAVGVDGDPAPARQSYGSTEATQHDVMQNRN